MAFETKLFSSFSIFFTRTLTYELPSTIQQYTTTKFIKM